MKTISHSNIRRSIYLLAFHRIISILDRTLCFFTSDTFDRKKRRSQIKNYPSCFSKWQRKIIIGSTCEAKSASVFSFLLNSNWKLTDLKKQRRIRMLHAAERKKMSVPHRYLLSCDIVIVRNGLFLFRSLIEWTCRKRLRFICSSYY